MIRILYPSFYIFLALISWWAFYQSSLETSTIYQPLRSFLLPITDSGLNLENFVIAIEHFKPSLSYKITNEIFTWLLVIINAAAFYFFLFKYKWKSLEQIKNYSLLLALSMLFLLPGDSSDLFGYIARGWQQAGYDMNPFHSIVSQVQDFNQDPMLVNCLWKNNPSPYGPLFMFIAKILCQISAGNFWLAMFLFKCLNFSAWYAVILISLQLVTEFIDKEKQNLCYTAIALNPLILIECLWNCHNDLVLLAFILVSIYLALKDKFNLSIIVLSLSVLVKYISLVLLPLYIIFNWKKNKQIAYLGIFLSLLIGIFFIDYYNLINLSSGLNSELDTAALGGNIILSHKSLFDCLNSLYKYVSQQDLPTICRLIFIATYGLLCVKIYYQNLFSNTEKHKPVNKRVFLSNCLLLLFLLVSIFSPKFHSWYLVNYLPLLCLMNLTLAISLSGFHLISLTFIDQANILNFVLMTVVPLIISRVKIKKFFSGDFLTAT